MFIGWNHTPSRKVFSVSVSFSFCIKKRCTATVSANPITVILVFPIGQWHLPYNDHINKTPLRNGKCPILEPITKIGVAHTMGQHLVTAYLELKYILIQSTYIIFKWP